MPRRSAQAACGLLYCAIASQACAQYPGYGGYGGSYNNYGEPNLVRQQIAAYIVAALAGVLMGCLFSPKLKPYRKYMLAALAVLVVFLSFSTSLPLNVLLSAVVCFAVFAFALSYGLAWGRVRAAKKKSITFGSAQWATAAMLKDRRMIGEQGLALGYVPDGEAALPLHYASDRHLLTVAPTRAGKGVSAIIPNLLTYRGSMLVIDPKGENAMVSALRRGAGDKARGIEGLGQRVYVVDPWNLTEAITGLTPARFNPLDWLDPASPEIGENAMMLADSLVVSAPGNKDPFWDEEAKALLMGLILHVATSPKEADNRHLGRVRDMLMLTNEQHERLMGEMLASDNSIVVSSAARTLGKDEKLQANVISSAQSHTHFLDSPRLRGSLSRSDFRFEDLKATEMTVYLVLPADRLNAFSRWLRLMIQQAITITARDITEQPERPILFFLDEMAALGRLNMVEQAYSLMAGFGMQLWGIVQDLSQLHRIYGDGWQTFIGNAGVLQYFGSRDKMTSEYFSALCGEATVETLTSSISKAFSSSSSGGSSSTSTSHNYGEVQRKLILADELMRVGSDVQLVLIENLDPIAGRKIEWYTDGRFKLHGVNLKERTAMPETESFAMAAE